MPSTEAWKGTLAVLALPPSTATMPPCTLRYCSRAGSFGRKALLPSRCSVYPERRAVHGHCTLVRQPGSLQSQAHGLGSARDRPRAAEV